MGNRTTWRWAVTLSALALMACGGQVKPEASSSRPAPTAGTMTAASSPATSSTSAIDPKIPIAARAHTAEGGSAFIRFFFSELNAAWSRPEAGRIGDLSGASCKTCTNFEQTAVKSVSKGQRVIGPSFVIETVSPMGGGQEPKTFVAKGHQPATRVEDANGHTVETVPFAKTNAYVTLEWAGGWKVAEIQEIS